MVKLAVPELVSAMDWVLVVPIATFPKPTLAGTAEIWSAFTVSVTALLVTLPAALLTTTVNCAPLSELVVVGVV
jgi:hypothetical protein